MWTITAPEVQHDWLSFEPVEVIHEYDWPRIFTCRDRAGDLFLAYFCGMSDGGPRFLVVPFNAYLHGQLDRGAISVRDFLLGRPRMWVFDIDSQWEPVRAWLVNPADLPRGAIPKPGVMIRAGLPRLINRFEPRPATPARTIKIVIGNGR